MKISVITVCYNAREHILDSINSVLNQKHVDFEYIIIDGASNDGSTEIIRERIKRTEGVVFISEPDDGMYDALNKGIKLSSGDIVGFLHADDIFSSDKSLRDILNAFVVNNEIDAVYSDLDYVSASDVQKVVRHWRSCPFKDSYLGRGWMPPHPTFYVKRDWYERIGYFDLDYKIAADYKSMLIMLRVPGFQTFYLPSVTVKMRTGGVSNRSIISIVRKSYEDFVIMRDVGFNIPNSLISLCFKNFSKLGQFFLK